MPGRNEREAWRGFRDPIVRVVNAFDFATSLVEREFGDGARLLASPTDGITFGVLRLDFSITVASVQESQRNFRMTTRRYSFTLTNRSGDRVLAWHWHPYSKRSRVAFPHVHVPSASSHSTKHIPTGRMCLEDIVLFGFDELGVSPTYEQARTNVIEIRDKHKQHRGWN